MKYKSETLQAQGREHNNKILYILCQVKRKKKKYKEASNWLRKWLKCFPFECF